MIKKRLLILTLLVVGSIGTVSVVANERSEGQQIIKTENKTIYVAGDTKNIVADNVTSSKIDTYEGILGYDWLGENQIIASKENKELKPIKTKLGEFEVQNLYSYDLNSKKEKSIANKSECQTDAISSPDKKHIFYSNDFQKENVGYIADSEGNIKVKINEPSMDVADLTQAYWINNEELIMPYAKIKGFYIVKTDGTSRKIENVETEKMATEDPLYGLYVSNPVKVGDKIYYTATNIDEKCKDEKMKVYDINTKQTKEFINEEVINFKLSPDKKHFIMEVINKQNNDLVVTDLNGENKQTLDEGYVFGENWSPDGTKVSYISNEEGKEGVYVVDVKTKKKSLICKGEYYEPTAWSPSGKKIMVHRTQPKEEKTVDVTNIITLD